MSSDESVGKGPSLLQWDDRAVEARVDRVISDGVALPRWGWKIPGPYNGSTGALRVAGWQKVQIACRQGWVPWASECSVCNAAKNLHYHTENYARPLFTRPICQSCHYRLHRRFRDPAAWQRFVATHETSCTWIGRIAVRELNSDEATSLAHLDDPSNAKLLGASTIATRLGASRASVYRLLAEGSRA
jgi:hypothetical protein